MHMKKKWNRIHVNLTDEDLEKLDAIAAHMGFKLMARHRARANHEGDRKKTLVYLIGLFWDEHVIS